MTPKPQPPHDPQEWVDRANSSLAHARAIDENVWLEDLCFDAQQAAEKAIKAVFVSRGDRVPYIHDLEELLGRLEENGLKAPKYVWESIELSRFAVLTRYPGLTDRVTQRTYRRAVRIATSVVRWAERQVGRHSPPT